MDAAEVELLKRRAGETAVDRFVRDGTCIGLGTGTTAYWAIERVGAMIAKGAKIEAVVTSVGTERLCRKAGVPVVALLEREIDVAIDGADEVAPDFSLTKGGGGALFREKSVALAAGRFVVIVDERKLVETLGAFPTPIEVVPFAVPWVVHTIEKRYNGVTITRRGGDVPYVTDNGNAILDCAFGSIGDPRALDRALREIHGVVSTGLFYDLADVVLVSDETGVRELEKRPPKTP